MLRKTFLIGHQRHQYVIYFLRNINYFTFSFHRNSLLHFIEIVYYIKAIKKYSNDLIYEDDINNNTDKIIFLNNKDNKIPNECLWYFYGGNSKDYLIFSD